MEYFVYLKCENKHTIHTMTKVLYKSYTQNDYFLFPPCIGDFIPENHPVRTVNAILDNFDISEIESTYKGGGTTSYHPRMASLLEESVFFMWLSGMSRPDFRTINRFRSERLADGRFESIFHQANMFYNQEQDFYVCPMGQHMEHITDKKTVSDLGYISNTSVYRAANCSKCPLRGLMHRSNRPIEPEACFGNIKFNHGFKRFHLKSTRKTKVEWGLVSLAHNLRKYVSYKAELKKKQAQSMVLVLEKTALKPAV